MKTKLILILLLAASLIGCKKDKIDTQLKSVVYTFVPNGTESSITYNNVNFASKHTTISVGDQVAIGDKVILKMSTTNIPSKYEVSITYNDRQIAVSSKIQYDGVNRYIVLEKTFTKKDF